MITHHNSEPPNHTLTSNQSFPTLSLTPYHSYHPQGAKKENCRNQVKLSSLIEGQGQGQEFQKEENQESGTGLRNRQDLAAVQRQIDSGVESTTSCHQKILIFYLLNTMFKSSLLPITGLSFSNRNTYNKHFKSDCLEITFYIVLGPQRKNVKCLSAHQMLFETETKRRRRNKEERDITKEEELTIWFTWLHRTAQLVCEFRWCLICRERVIDTPGTLLILLGVRGNEA